jgi:hypothetical protein
MSLKTLKMKTITVRRVDLQFDAERITDPTRQVDQAIELINRVLQREPAGLAAQLIVTGMKLKLIMPKFICSYAHDIACFADFTVEARSERAALRQIRRALKAGRFNNVDPSPCWENGPANQRVFVQGQATEYAPTTTLAEIINERKSHGSHHSLPAPGQRPGSPRP